MLADVPQAMTGPAMVNIFTQVPKIMPSALNSTAADETALAKPVIGTSVPAPALLAILWYIRRAVNSTPRNTIVIGQPSIPTAHSDLAKDKNS